MSHLTSNSEYNKLLIYEHQCLRQVTRAVALYRLSHYFTKAAQEVRFIGSVRWPPAAGYNPQCKVSLYLEAQLKGVSFHVSTIATAPDKVYCN
jgi:hypothetical protein